MARSVVILGGAKCVWEDLDNARRFGTFDATFAINDMLAHYPGEIDVFVSLHPEKAAEWLKQRDAKGFPRPKKRIAHENNTQQGRPNAFRIDETLEYRWPGMSGSGSSGLFAVKVAIGEGFDRIVLCGVPMTPEPHFFDGKPWSECSSFTKAWTEALRFYADKTRSMSGWTRDLLGEPTKDWLARP
ncbi:hypothetical protein [Rhodobium gokarnense]|uniref:Phage protein n=1 Tax=Rhodobium gokarnense TaxID=364296 RepID=A0ABT3HHB4_9HYPH|nr:hypothetical protein [Rhodobium gokarnense]MCW2309734.1 hypothetical protein [Rhodobium gokarnense]